MYNYYQQQTTTKPIATYAPPPFLKGHPVSPLEEVRATSIDFDGSIFYFPDIANKRIYTKTNVVLTLDQEELLADIFSTYGNEIIMVTNKVFAKIKKDRYF